MATSLYMTQYNTKSSYMEEYNTSMAFAIFNITIILLLMFLTVLEFCFSGEIRIKGVARFCGGCCRSMRRVFCCKSKYDKDGFMKTKTKFDDPDKKDEDVDWDYFEIDKRLEQKEQNAVE